MGTGRLSIDLGALAANWRALDQRSSAGVETGAVVKSDAYGLGVDAVVPALAAAGARQFFVAVAEEGQAVRAALGPGPQIFVFEGHQAGDTQTIRAANLMPLLNAPDQLARHLDALPDHPFGLQLDTGMNRLGFEPADWATVRTRALAANPKLIISHLACADDPAHPMNAQQRALFTELTHDTGIPRSLAATGGTLLGADYHFEATRPGIGLYGGLPFADAAPVATLSLPVIQVRDLTPGETVGYGNTWTATGPARIATLSAGYADGLLRAMGGKLSVFAGATPCPLVGRVSMDLLTADVTGLDCVPDPLDILTRSQTIDTLAGAAGTIGYEILTSLGLRYGRRYFDGGA